MGIIGEVTFSPDHADGVCILVVEDDDADAFLIEGALRRIAGVKAVARASNGLEAIQQIASGRIKPELALIDLHMPLKDGCNLMAELVARFQPSFPMVVLTSAPMGVNARRNGLHLASRVITKPDSMVELETVLADIIHSARRGAFPPIECEAPVASGI